jgi:hypothetical protein
VKNYATHSRIFTVAPAALQFHDVAVDAGKVSVHVNYPNAPSTGDGAGEFSTLDRKGYWLRLQDVDAQYGGDNLRYAEFVGPRLAAAAALTVTIAPQGGGAGEAAAGVGVANSTVDYPLVTARAADGSETVTTLAGVESSLVTFDAPAAGEYTVTVTDSFGNTGEFELTAP